MRSFTLINIFLVILNACITGSLVYGGKDLWIPVGNNTRAILSGNIQKSDGTTVGYTGGAVTSAITNIDGTQAAPSYTFTTDTDVGMYLAGANNGAIVAGNTELINYSISRVAFGVPLRLSNESVTAPALSWTGQTGGGLFRDSSDDSINMAISGSEVFEWDNAENTSSLRLYLKQTPSVLILTSADGTCASCGIDNTDVFTCTSIACP